MAACGSDSGGDSSAASGDTGARSLLPDSIREEGEVKVAVNAEYPPWQYLDKDKQYVGLEVDLDKAIAKRLGIKVHYSNVSFDAIIPGLQSRRYDMGSSTVTDTKEREQVVDFVDFYRKVNVLVVKAGNPEGIKTLDDMCGKVAAAQSGTDWAHLFEAQNDKCKAAGKPEIDLKEFPLNTDTALAVQSGRAAATLEDYVSATRGAEQSKGKLEVLSDEKYAPSLYGFAFQKGDSLAKAWEAGLEEIIANGTYDKIFAKWKVDIGRLTAAQVNGAAN